MRKQNGMMRSGGRSLQKMNGRFKPNYTNFSYLVEQDEEGNMTRWKPRRMYQKRR